jgi:hypothetical protein
MSKIEKYTVFAEGIAKDDSHGYDQTHRNGKPDYDCSALVCEAVQRSGIKVKDAGASYTGNMLKAFKKCGFKDVTKEVTLSTAKGMKRGDILLAVGKHTAIFCGNKKMVDARINEKGTIKGGKAGDQTGHEIEIHNYINQGWTNVLRYEEPEQKSTGSAKTETKKTEVKSYKASEYAQHKSDLLVGTYTTTAKLNMRHGAGTDKQSMIVLPKGTKVTCYGYYSKSAGIKWLYVFAVIGKKQYTGFCSSNYLKKMK